jgi:hypothetical protein
MIIVYTGPHISSEFEYWFPHGDTTKTSNCLLQPLQHFATLIIHKLASGKVVSCPSPKKNMRRDVDLRVSGAIAVQL